MKEVMFGVVAASGVAAIAGCSSPEVDPAPQERTMMVVQRFAQAVAKSFVEGAEIRTTLYALDERTVLAEQTWNTVSGRVEWRDVQNPDNRKSFVFEESRPLEMAGRQAVTAWKQVPARSAKLAPRGCKCVREAEECMPIYTCREVCVVTQLCFPCDPAECGGAHWQCQDIPCEPYEDCSVEYPGTCTTYCAEYDCTVLS